LAKIYYNCLFALVLVNKSTTLTGSFLVFWQHVLNMIILALFSADCYCIMPNIFAVKREYVMVPRS